MRCDANSTVPFIRGMNALDWKARAKDIQGRTPLHTYLSSNIHHTSSTIRQYKSTRITHNKKDTNWQTEYISTNSARG